MTDFVRIPGKIFAENASPVGNDPQIGKFGNAKQGIYTGEADVREIQNSEAWSQGWTEAVVSAMNYPPLPEMNGVLKVLSYQICYLLQKGIPEWNADTVYYKNDYVNYNGKLYYSNIDNNTFEPETRGAGNSWLSGTSDVAIATLDSNGISRPDGETVYVDEDGTLRSPKWNLFDLIQKDHILTFEEKEGLELLGEYVYKEAAPERYGYPDFYAKCLEEYKDGTDNTEEIEGITIKIHSNGHKFYDIKDKDKIDEIYEKQGIAWYYGIDEENQRILLPRNKYFFQAADSSEVGNSVKAGLPNIKGGSWAGWVVNNYLPTGAVKAHLGNDGLTGAKPGVIVQSSFVFDASLSNPIYSDDVNTVQPPAVKMLIYMVVGNTAVSKSPINIIEITSSEDDSIPLGMSVYSGKPLENNAGWVKASDVWLSANVYTSFYNKAIAKIGQAFAGGVIKENTEEYTEYDLVINKENMTFRLPLKQGQLENVGDLYFKLGNALENLELIDAGQVFEELNNKIGKTECKSYIIDTYTDGRNGYRVWSDGYCEQWGYILTLTSWTPVNLYKSYSDGNYNISIAPAVPTAYDRDLPTPYVDNNTTNSLFYISIGGENPRTFWKTSGYLPEGTY